MENTELDKKRKELEKKKECLTKVARHHIEILMIMQNIVETIYDKTLLDNYKEYVKQSMELLLGNDDSNIIDSSIENVFNEEFNNNDEAIQKG